MKSFAIESGQHGGLIWEISAAVAPSSMEALFAPISFKVDREKRRATVLIPDIGETNIEPIKNPVTGEEHRARIVLPDGFEYKEAEMGNTDIVASAPARDWRLNLRTPMAN